MENEITRDAPVGSHEYFERVNARSQSKQLRDRNAAIAMDFDSRPNCSQFTLIAWAAYKAAHRILDVKMTDVPCEEIRRVQGIEAAIRAIFAE
jgi:hypothetical protein